MNIYFAGIGGVGIGPLAQIARDAGNSVQGSDLSESLTTHRLIQQGIPVDTNQDGTFLRACNDSTPIDWFVYSASLPEDHPELVTARALGIKTSKRDALLAHIISAKKLKLIAVAGTHGKTTTTGMAVWAFKQLGIPISYSVGSTLSFGPSGAFDPKSEYFIYECDEFDRNFLHFFPHLSLITSVGYDHPDVYPTEQSYMQAFRQFLDQSQQVIMWQHDGDRIQATEKDGWILRETEVQSITLAGEHNRRNATLVLKGLEYLQLTDAESARKILASFPGTDRRFEKLADHLYSDYGHHPSEIAATLQMARELSDHVVLVYQPHQNVRQHEIRDLYTHCFELAETIYWLPTYLSREDPALPILTPQQLAINVTNREAIHFSEMNDRLWKTIQDARENGKLVLLMGAGSIDSWARRELS
ncbi:MAG TPA: Mur ligase domain-containing protein [Candidatus Saccharimonadales bacterium]|nr:Mur ligase domain-containing protein [Candidatus Saccharimonadales bacterium]